MKNYTTLTLKQLGNEQEKCSKELIKETFISSKIGKPANYEPILNKIKNIEEIIKKRTGTPVRCSLPKRIQRELGLLPKI